MNFLILGSGAEEEAWARAIVEEAEHRILAAYPGLTALPHLTPPADFEEAFATAGIEAVVVGGSLELRGEWLRRVAAVGLPAICLHPPGDDSEAYYQVALSRDETGAVLIPDLPMRLHPGVAALELALLQQQLGAYRDLRYEIPAQTLEGDLTRHVFARAVDVVRALLGEVTSVTATGDPPGDHPNQSLVVQLRGPEARRAEIRIVADGSEPARLTVHGEKGSLMLEYDPKHAETSRLIERLRDTPQRVVPLPAWNPNRAILTRLKLATSGQSDHPSLNDGTRAMELAEAAVRSLKRGRTVDLHYEQISELHNFKSVMTSLGCLLLLLILGLLPLALAGPALGIRGTIYFAYAILPVLIGFALLQILRFAARGTTTPHASPDPPRSGNAPVAPKPSPMSVVDD